MMVYLHQTDFNFY